MAKGELEFNGEQAQAAADNLAALSKLNQMSFWPPGTSTAELGDQTRALPVGWESESMDDVMAKATALTEAAMAMQGAAGSPEGVQANIGVLGGACGGCHKVYRQPSTYVLWTYYCLNQEVFVNVRRAIWVPYVMTQVLRPLDALMNVMPANVGVSRTSFIPIIDFGRIR